MKLIREDVFTAQLEPKHFALVYADPPYANCRFKYARHTKASRQWGRSARHDFMRELIARCESLRAPDGVAAISMATPELLLLPLFPSGHRVLAWCKPYAPFRPGVWPAYSWEPLIAWGKFPGRPEQKASQTPPDWLMLAPERPKAGGHENPKPIAFGAWVINQTLGPRRGPVCELFAGTAPVALTAERLGCEAVAVDLDDYRPGLLRESCASESMNEARP